MTVENEIKLAKTKAHTISVVIDRVVVKPEAKSRIADSVHALGDYTIWRVPPQNKDWDEDLKALNGREAIPAEQESTPETNNIELTM